MLAVSPRDDVKMCFNSESNLSRFERIKNAHRQGVRQVQSVVINLLFLRIYVEHIKTLLLRREQAVISQLNRRNVKFSFTCSKQLFVIEEK